MLALLIACTPDIEHPGTRGGPTTGDPGTTPTATHDSGAATDSAGSFGSTPTDTGTLPAPPFAGVAPAAVAAWGSITLPQSVVTDLAIAADGGVALFGAVGGPDPSGPAGAPSVTRLDPTGAADTAWAGDGSAISGGWQVPYALATAADGGLFVGAGTDLGAAGGGTGVALVDKLDPTGRIDPSFSQAAIDHASTDRILDLVALDDGGVLVLGASTRPWLRRYGSDGVGVPFGSDPEVVLPGSCGCGTGRVLIRSDGTLIVAVDDQATRVDSLGRPDLGYGTDGTATIRGLDPGGAALEADGSVVFVGTGGGSPAVVRVDPAGVVGSPIAVVDPDGSDALVEIAVDGLGRWMLAGARTEGDSSSALLARTDAAGAPDPAWGSGGFAVEDAIRLFQRVRVAGNGTVIAVGSGLHAVVDAFEP